MSLIQVTNLTFAYDNSLENIFENVTFHFDTNWRLGFIGRNGRGKTTFLNLLLGKYDYSGTISSPLSFNYFPFDVEDITRPARDIAKEITPGFELWQLLREISLLELNEDILDRPFETLSLGERTKFLLAVLFLRDNSFLLIDEPTNHLDIHAREITSRYLRTKEGFILVSHDRVFLDSCIDHIISINKTNIETHRGNFTSWQKNKDMQDAFELSENQRLKKQIGRLNEASKRTAGWSDKIEKSKIGSHSGDRGYIGHKSAKMMNRAKATQRRQQAAIDEKSKLLHNIENADNLILRPVAHHAPRLVEAGNLNIYYGSRLVCKNINFTLKTGSRLAITGRNGSGKSSILKLIMGEDIAHSGVLYKANGLKISYVSQDTSMLSGKLQNYAAAYNINQSLFMAILRKLDFTRLQFEKDMRDFSGGQKKKVLLARSLCEEAHIYIWDEPLNFIDVLSRMQIENLILKYEPTMIFIEHDRSFVDAVATDIILL